MTRTGRILIAFSALGMLGGAAVLAHAGPHGEGMKGPAMMNPGRIFSRLDANHDGVVTKEEAQKAPMMRFAKLDADGDGKATVAEIDAAIKKRLERRIPAIRYRLLARLDANGDGIVSSDEVKQKRMRLFARADRNGDGKVTKEEAAMLRRHFMKGKRGMRKMMMRKMMMRGMGGAGFRGQMGD